MNERCGGDAPLMPRKLNICSLPECELRKETLEQPPGITSEFDNLDVYAQ